MDEILSQKPVLKEDYYAILGCDELSTVCLCYIILLYGLCWGTRLGRLDDNIQGWPWLGMRGITVSEKYRGIKSDGIIYRGLAKYRGIPSGGIDFQ